jgi:hypothetical protein
MEYTGGKDVVIALFLIYTAIVLIMGILIGLFIGRAL